MFGLPALLSFCSDRKQSGNIGSRHRKLTNIVIINNRCAKFKKIYFRKLTDKISLINTTTRLSSSNGHIWPLQCNAHGQKYPIIDDVVAQ